MEETMLPKRPREAQMEKDLDFEEYLKRHKPYNHILSILDSEEEESTQDISPMMKTLQQEITCASNNHDTLLMFQDKPSDENTLTSFVCNNFEDNISSLTCFSNPQYVLNEEEDEDEKVKVMRHLLQASDDELGIPNTSGDDGLIGFGGENDGFNGGDEFSSLCDKLWEIEDERANYYALLQSELFQWGN